MSKIALHYKAILLKQEHSWTVSSVFIDRSLPPWKSYLVCFCFLNNQQNAHNYFHCKLYLQNTGFFSKLTFFLRVPMVRKCPLTDHSQWWFQGFTKKSWSSEDMDYQMYSFIRYKSNSVWIYIMHTGRPYCSVFEVLYCSRSGCHERGSTSSTFLRAF